MQDTSLNITRGARTLKGRLPAVEDDQHHVLQWKTSTQRMKRCMMQGTFEPFKQALEAALLSNNSTLDKFTAEASALLRRRRLYRADGAAAKDPAAGDAASAPFLGLMQKVVEHMVTIGKLSLHDVANFETYLFFSSCLLGTAVLRDQAYRRNLIDDVYMDENGFICESIFAPLQLKVQASASEAGHLLVADCKPREATLGWLMLICAVRPMRVLLDKIAPSKLLWGMGGNDNSLVSKSSWATRIKGLSKAHLGSPRTGTLRTTSMFDGTNNNSWQISRLAGHGVYRLMNITVKIYDVRRQFGGITEPGAKSMLLSHAHKCNTSLDTMLVSVLFDTKLAHLFNI
jgi:hypothetical protein